MSASAQASDPAAMPEFAQTSMPSLAEPSVPALLPALSCPVGTEET
ncbi:hypothetical protein B8V81_3471 [Paenibacillus pasadenensis]|uniref:Uncharacterized protein n=1 Tax=Paenibacillus pasadenensis TaxID=217090 RepID=A0A2N5N3Z8_9BACL|nr:hypothetical protein B8V81_3471 [Paenibacillus pasadenensis]